MSRTKLNIDGTGSRILLVFIAIGAFLIGVRYIGGIGAVSNLSDGYPWGIWIGIDLLTGVALAAGGFTLAALVHIFGKEKYHSVIRPAILTAFLGYIFVILGLLVDLGRSWYIWHSLFFWNKDSAMFEVGWCVMLYLTVLALEFAPVVFEEYEMTEWQVRWEKFAPWISVFLVSWFVFVMSGYPIYAGITFAVLAFFLITFRRSLPKGGTVIILIMAGVIFSIAHQASLGSLFLIVPTKLSALWYTPFLPLNFLLSAVSVGFAMVIFESTLSSKVFGFGLEEDVIKGLAKILPWTLLVAAVVRFWTLYNQTGFVFDATSAQMLFFAVEIIVGLIIPFLLLMVPAIAGNPTSVFNASIMVIIGVVLNRVNVSIVGIIVPNHATYIPHVFEILITVGIISAGLMTFYVMCHYLPIFEKK